LRVVVRYGAQFGFYPGDYLAFECFMHRHWQSQSESARC
jgi:hypothetical protein